jgi:hypothetical protein
MVDGPWSMVNVALEDFASSHCQRHLAGVLFHQSLALYE